MTKNSILFFDGICEDPNQLRGQILAEIQSNLPESVNWRCATRTDTASAGDTTVSFFSDFAADILLMFDLSDRNIFLLDGPDGQPFVQSFKKILVAGPWLQASLLANTRLGLSPENVIAVGSPRVDLLRRLQSKRPRPARDPEAGPRILIAPMPDNWRDSEGHLMSVTQELKDVEKLLSTRFDVTTVQDSPNRPNKLPITNELLDADVVITDYASVMYEAWALGKPVIFPRWLTGDRVLQKGPKSAEAHVYRKRIGHHPESLLDLFMLLEDFHKLGLGNGVETFLREYLSNFDGTEAGLRIAQLLQALNDPNLEIIQRPLRLAMEDAIAEGDWEAAQALVTEIIALDPVSPSNFGVQANIYNKLGDTAGEITALKHATSLSPNSAGLFDRLAQAHSKLRQNRAAAESWKKAISINPKKAPAKWYYNVGYMLETRGVDGPRDVPAAREAYSIAIEKNGKAATLKYGVGTLHCSTGRWKEAQTPFKDLIRKMPFDGELYYRLGMAHDRCYEWTEAEACYRKALAFDMSKSSWHYRLGFVLERQERWDAAAEAYLHAANLATSHQATWFYRAGYVLEKAGRLEEACATFSQVVKSKTKTEDSLEYVTRLKAEKAALYRSLLDRTPEDAKLWMDYSKELEAAGDIEGAFEAARKATQRTAKFSADYAKRRDTLRGRLRRSAEIEARLEYDCTNPLEWHRLSVALEANGNIDGTIEALRQALMRNNEHKTEWYNHLGVLLTEQGRLEEACDAFRSQHILQRPHGVLESKFAESDTLRETATYREFHDTLPMMEKAVMYESFGGEGCSDNPLAMFQQIQNDPRFEGWRHIWSIQSPDKIPPILRNRKDVIFVQKGSTLYQRYLATLPYLINNATFPFYYVRRDGQHYLNTWHGTPLKTLGYDVEATPLQRANTARNLIQASMFIAPNKHTEEVMLGRYGARNLFTGTSLISGYPRIDMMINASDTEKTRIRKQLGLDPSKPVVLFAPTYRGHWATPELEAQSLAASLERMKSDDYNLIFRGHYFAEKFIDEMNLDVNIAPHSIDTCNLLSIVDILITDYSSIFYDFLITKRPVIHFVPDWDYYVETRGVYFGKDQLPGHICEDEETLLETLEHCIADPEGQITPQYLADLERYCACEDGKASERVVEALFFDLPPDPVNPERLDDQKHFVFYAGTCDTGPELRNLRGLTKETSDKGHINTVLVDRYLIINSAARTTNTQALLDRADVVMRFGRATLSLEETWIDSKLKMNGFTPPQAFLDIFKNATAFEARRVVGHARFDAAVELNTQRPFWTRTLPSFDSLVSIANLGRDFAETRDFEIAGLDQVEDTLGAFDILLSPTAASQNRNKESLSLNGPSFAIQPPFVDPDALPRADIVEAPWKQVVCFATDPVEFFKDPLIKDPALCQSIKLSLFVPPRHVIETRKRSRLSPFYGHIKVFADTEDSLPELAEAQAVVFPQGVERAYVALTEASVSGKPCFAIATKSAVPNDVVQTFRSVVSLGRELGVVLQQEAAEKENTSFQYNKSAFEQFLAIIQPPVARRRQAAAGQDIKNRTGTR